MNDLINRIEKLSREETLIAAQNVTLQITQNASCNEREEELPKPFIDKPSENVQEIEQLARLILLAGAVSSESEQVSSAITAVSEKEALEGTETVVLATLGLFALSLLIAKPESKKAHTIKIEEEGKKTAFVIEDKFSDEISPSLGQVLKTYFGNVLIV